MLFPKRVGGPRDGQFAGLDFGHLVDLAAIDRELRGFPLPLTLDVENSTKTRLIERITEKPGEDGYSRFVPREKAEGTPERLLALADRSKLHGDWYASNTVITSSHDFIARVFGAWLG